MTKGSLLFFCTVGLVFFLSSYSTVSVSLEKIWIFQKYNSDNQSFIYKSELTLRDATGFQFLPDGQCKVRQNTNSCGTDLSREKIQYETVDGTWYLTRDSILVINHIQFGDSLTKQFRILSITESNLIVKHAFLP